MEELKELTNRSTFAEIKAWFESAELPGTLEGSDRYYANVRFTANKWIESVEAILKNLGRPNDHAKYCKERLLTLYQDLQNKENWNIKFPL